MYVGVDVDGAELENEGILRSVGKGIVSLVVGRELDDEFDAEGAWG